MRQTQQNNRRGRGRGGKKTQNPFSKNFESNGPDVKIRGTASHIADKYQSLSRDSMSSGDFIKSENYLQHAEHYNRIMMAAQNAQAKANERASEGSDQAPADGNKADEAPDDDGHVLEDFDLTLSQVNSASNTRNQHSRGNGRGNGRDHGDSGRPRRTRTGLKNGRGRRPQSDTRSNSPSENKGPAPTSEDAPASKDHKEPAKRVKKDAKEAPIS